MPEPLYSAQSVTRAANADFSVDLGGTRSPIFIAEIKIVAGGKDGEIGLDSSVGDEKYVRDNKQWRFRT